MDADAGQRHCLESMLAQRTLMGMSDSPGQFRQDPMMALIDQARRAREGHHEGGMNYLTMPF